VTSGAAVTAARPPPPRARPSPRQPGSARPAPPAPGPVSPAPGSWSRALRSARVVLHGRVHLHDDLVDLVDAAPLVLAAAAMPATMSLIRRTDVTMSSSVRPDRSTSTAPRSTRSTDSRIRALISLAALADRWARFRTSAATTANPRPCSPARAASTAALSASRFVWNAELVSSRRRSGQIFG